jgi:hypothetical protein
MCIEMVYLCNMSCHVMYVCATVVGRHYVCLLKNKHNGPV